MKLSEHLPEVLLAAGPRGIAVWQWIALALALLTSALVGSLLGRATRAGLGVLTRRTRVNWDDKLLDSVVGPLTWFWILGAAYILTAWLELPAPAIDLLHRALRTGAFLVFFWILLRLVSLAGRAIESSPWAASHLAARSLVPLGVRMGRIAVAAIAVVGVLADLGYPVASLVAGLGIGGLALALAGQKTVENLFGAFSIGLDQPFSVGDAIRVDGIEGEVEAIGLRSTRLRTGERSVVSMPNGKLAEMRIERLSARDRLRLSTTLALVYGTRADQVRAVLAGVEQALRSHPKIWPDNVIVRLRELGQEALLIEVMAWFQTTDFEEFRAIRQELLLAFMEVVERAGTAFALPARTVHLVDKRT